ncbi:hypothetical protein [Lapillicoccus sp.]|uniref:hypothetical protein n=1 Tax=Lapillicoccus sp. TaxID=1909287 RepID=UPI0025F85F75|nr:hypothetical protein [Lapillicoccus sp.]
MAMTTDDEIMSRAVDAFQDRAEQESAEWPAVASGVRDRVRRSSLVSRSVRAHVADLSGTTTFTQVDTLVVSDRVVVDALRRGLSGIPEAAAETLSLVLDGRDCVGVRVELVAGYGTDLRVLGDRVRTLVEATLTDTLGIVVPVDVTVVDVVVGDPSR